LTEANHTLTFSFTRYKVIQLSFICLPHWYYGFQGPNRYLVLFRRVHIFNPQLFLVACNKNIIKSLMKTMLMTYVSHGRHIFQFNKCRWHVSHGRHISVYKMQVTCVSHGRHISVYIMQVICLPWKTHLSLRNAWHMSPMEDISQSKKCRWHMSTMEKHLSVSKMQVICLPWKTHLF
jgi:hypothetical protein